MALALVTSAQSQTPADPPDKTYSLGLRMPSKDEVASFPKAAETRGLTPPKADLSAFMPPIGDQGIQGSCVAWSTGYALRSYYVAKLDKLPITEKKNVPSPAYIYNHANWSLGRFNCKDAGMLPHIALDILKGGVASLADMPYDQATCYPGPSVEMQTRAANQFRINAWEYVLPKSLEQLKGQLAQGNPIVFGTQISKSLVAHRGTGVYARDEKEPFVGGHAMVLIGYDDDRKAFRLQNSWGAGWGDQGRAWIAYDTFTRDVDLAFIIYPAKAN